MSKTYVCSGCKNSKPRGEFHEAHYTDRSRVVTSRCRGCRSEDYFTDRYKTVCGQCRRHRPLDQNRVCKKCNGRDPVEQLIIQWGPGASEQKVFLPYNGPLPDSDEYKAAVAVFDGCITGRQVA